ALGRAAAGGGVPLRGGAGSRVWATGGGRRGVPGGAVGAAPPLDVPDLADDDAAELARSPAVRLFVARAAAAAPGFTLTAGTAPAVAVLCRRLDGVPLALELAATPGRALGVAELVAPLDDRLPLPAAARRDGPAAQGTLIA